MQSCLLKILCLRFLDFFCDNIISFIQIQQNSIIISIKYLLAIDLL